ncbi:MAG: YxeA family protein [Coriobacteriia bacterium]|nr:YxeA family protein [Coriobacteriia bacterium]
MKKRPVLWIVLALVAVVVVAGAIWGKQYYDARYVGADYYAMVPQDYDTTSHDIKSMNGEVVGTGVDYKLTAYNARGEARPVAFTVADPGTSISRGEEQPQPGAYLWVSASKQIVVRWKSTEQNAIPEKALEMIRKNH